MRSRWFFVLATALAASCTLRDPVSVRLNTTPRHDEWIVIESAGRPLHAYVVYPQTKRKAGAVLVIHENRGLTDWARSVADRLAEQGYLAIAPDMLSGAGPNGGRTKDFASEDAARQAISALPPDQVMADLRNAAAYIRKQPSSNGKLAVAGFCWGGARAFQFANVEEDVTAAFVFYGTGPQDAAGVSGIEAPVYGFYGGDDARVNATTEPTRELMRMRGGVFELVIYEGAGHAFMRLGEGKDATEANRKARDAAWVRWSSLLRALD